MDVLIIDDHDDTRATMCLLFQAYGFETVAFPSGEEAVACLAASGDFPCVIFLDYLMPGMNGAETIEAIRHIPGCAALPLYVVTGYSVCRDRLPPDVPLLLKPQSVVTLVAIATAHCGRGHRARGRGRRDAPPESPSPSLLPA